MQLTSKRARLKMTVVMSLIIAQVSLTCVWLVFDGEGDHQMSPFSIGKGQFRLVVPYALPQSPGEMRGSATSPQAADGLLPLPSERLSNTTRRKSPGDGRAPRANETKDKPRQGPAGSLQRVHTSQSKWLLRLSASATSYCGGRVESYGNVTALLRDAVVDPAKAYAKARGGETINQVLLQQEKTEFYQLRRGFVNVDNCSDQHPGGRLSFGHTSEEGGGLSGAITLSRGADRSEAIPNYKGDFVMVLTRYEYANVYWTVIDLYNTFLMMQLYNRTFLDTDLLILDAHPHTMLDGLFEGTFRRVFRPSALPTKTRFPNLLPCFGRKDSPILMKVLRPLTLAGQFRGSTLSALGVSAGTEEARARRCRDERLAVLFVWRRNYVGHPRNPKGTVSRKIANEAELLNGTRQHFANYSVRGVQLDQLPVREQLELIGNADIFVGMHGAAFGFTLFMREGGGVLELWPRTHQGNWHMEYLAKRSGLYYKKWQNDKDANENLKEMTTIVSIPAITRKLKGLTASVCAKYK